MTYFTVYDFQLEGSVVDRPEAMGTKEKYWLRTVEIPVRQLLFKVGRENTGENWAERVACEISRKIGLPSVQYQLATCMGARGVFSEKMHPDGTLLFPANVLLSRIIDGYDGSMRFGHLQYTVQTCIGYIRQSRLLPPVPGELSAADVFVGYLVFDCLIGNTDRHHENWAVFWNTTSDSPIFRLAPTYDHASCLGRELTDQNRATRRLTKDHRANVRAYAERGRSAFFGAQGRKTLTHRELLSSLVTQHGAAVRIWAERIVALEPSYFEEILARIPSDWISTESVEFACKLLAANQEMIREVAGV